VKATLSILLMILLSAAVSAQEESLLMPEGAYGTTVKAGLAPGETRTYYLNAEKGQQFTAKLVSVEDKGYLLITDSEGQSLLDDLPNSAQVRNLNLILPSSGKYTLQVASQEDGHCSYLLEVTLDDPAMPIPE
jgi:hypothetical protein